MGLALVKERPMIDAKHPYAEIGQRIDTIRVAFGGLSQKDWAQKHGFGVTQAGAWITGQNRISVDAAQKLCDLYGLSLDWIYRGRVDGLSITARNALSGK